MIREKMKDESYEKDLTESEPKLLKDNRELYALHMEIHKLLEDLITKTNLGSIEESYADEINFDIGEHSIYSCAYYQQVFVTSPDGNEYELEHDLERTRELYAEIKKRADEFDKIIKTKSLKIAVKVFQKPWIIHFEDLDEGELD
ncbi:MAG: hypothetical protein AABX11_06055 [Nanoarchaeota archaeon]